MSFKVNNNKNLLFYVVKFIFFLNVNFLHADNYVKTVKKKKIIKIWVFYK